MAGKLTSSSSEGLLMMLLWVPQKIVKALFKECLGSNSTWPYKNPHRSGMKTRLLREFLDYSRLSTLNL